MNNIINIFGVVFKIIFNKSNFIKFLIIFSVGFVSRVLVGYFLSIDICLDYLNLLFV